MSEIKVAARNFGPFKEAEVVAKPLTVFVGGNNVGKSMLLRLLWALSATPHGAAGLGTLRAVLAERLRRVFGDLGRLVRVGVKEAVVELYAGGEVVKLRISGDVELVRWPGDVRRFVEGGLFTGDAIFFADNEMQIYVTPSFPAQSAEKARAVQNANAMAGELLEELGVRVKKRDVMTWNGLKVEFEELPLSVARTLAITMVIAAEGELQSVFIEEPEAHLHPRAQMALARVVARGVNRGKRVLFTTHSDYLLYAISDLIAAHSRGPEALGFGRDEVLNPSDVAVHRVRREGDAAVVEPVKVSEDGIDEDEFATVAEEAANRRAKIMAISAKK